VRLAYADLGPHLNGTDLGTSRWIRVDQPRIDGFAHTTEDDFWLHTDPERAADGPYGGTIAHGFLTLSLVAPVLGDLLQVAGASSQVNYGLDRVRFPSALPVGSDVRGRATLVDVAAVDGGHRLTVEVEMRARDADRPACVATLLTLVLG
jgi:acyl dehydratase